MEELYNLLLKIIANSPEGSQLGNLDTLDGSEGFLVFKPGEKRPYLIQKDKITFPGEPATTFLSLSDTEDTYTGQEEKILFVKIGGGIGFKTIAEVSGITKEAIISALNYTPLKGVSVNGGTPQLADINGIANITVSATGGTPPPADYADVAAMLADQANQVENEEYTVTNANGWSTISHSGWATFKKKATSTASESDYDLREQQDFDTDGAEVHTEVTYTWNTGDSQIFTVADSSKTTDVYVQGNRLIKGAGEEWNVNGATGVEILVPLNDGDKVAIVSSATSAGEGSVNVIDNLTSTSTTDALSANQGKVLDENKLAKTANITALWTGTQASYDALTPDANTLYFIQ